MIHIRPLGLANFLLFAVIILFIGCRSTSSYNYSHVVDTDISTYYNDSLKFEIKYLGPYKFQFYPLLKKSKLKHKSSKEFDYSCEEDVLKSLFHKHRLNIVFTANRGVDLYMKSTCIRYKGIRDLNTTFSIINKEMKRLTKENGSKTDTIKPYSTINGFSVYHMSNLLGRKHLNYDLEDYFIYFNGDLLRFTFCVCLERSFPYGEPIALHYFKDTEVPMIINTFTSYTKGIKKVSAFIDPFTVAYNAFSDGLGPNYLLPILKLTKISDSASPDGDYIRQAKSTYYTFAGNYDSAALIRCITQRNYKEPAPSNKANTLREINSGIDVSDMEKIVPAKRYIIDHYSNKKVLMFNEDHSNYQHRMFMDNLLQALYNAGFRYLAIETLFYGDIDINTRKYPVIKSGFYSREASFANMIRSAAKIGFRLVPYEDTTHCTVKNCLNYRDSMQASNLCKILSKDPAARIIVYAGFSHIAKKTEPGWTHMAQYFKKKSGIDPICIDQVGLSALPCLEYFDLIKEIQERYSPSEPSVLLTKTNKVFITPGSEGLFDIRIYHPFNSKLYEMPQGLRTEKYTVPDLSTKNLPSVFQLQIYRSEELNKSKELAIPTYQRSMKSIKNGLNLYLPKDNYMLLIKDSLGVVCWKQSFN